MSDSSIEISLIDTLKESELTAIAADTVELGLDRIIDEGLLQDIPVVSTVINLVKAGANVRDYFFTKKLLKFLAAMSDLPKEERRKLVEKLEADGDYRQKVGENIILLLERMDDIHKPELMARAFKAYLSSMIDSVQLQRFNYAIDRLLMCDISKLPEFSQIESTESYDLIIGQNFLNAGLAYVGTGYGAGGIGPNDICRLFVEHVLKV